MTIEEILQLDDINLKISYLKKRKTKAPDAVELMKEWDPDRHEIHDEVKYPKRKIKVRDAITTFDGKSGKKKIIEPEKFEYEDINRISVPLEQDIVNIQTAFTVGLEPSMDCNPDDSEKSLFEALKSVLQKNKIKYQNKKVVRSWLSEQEIAEYWYTVEDEGFWNKLWNRLKVSFGSKAKPNRRLKSVLWSPFRGDKLYPYFDDYGDLVALSRSYKKRDIDDIEYECFMTITKDAVYMWEDKSGWIEKGSFKHGFPKLPVIYDYRPESYCHKIQPFRIRLEKTLSSYADCMDRHFFPLLMLTGDVEGFQGNLKNRIAKLSGQGANAQYLTWNQAIDTIKFEVDTIMTNAYSMTNTPQIRFDKLESVGSTSGTALKLMFMGAHMSVSNHAETIGMFFQRRVNFLLSALGAINVEYSVPAQTLDIDVELTPYMIDDMAEKVNTAVAAVDGGVFSRKEGIIFCGNALNVDETLADIESDMEKKEKQNSLQQEKEDLIAKSSGKQNVVQEK